MGRIATIFWAIIQSLNIVLSVKPFIFNLNLSVAISVVICLTSGSMVSLWLSEIITEKGIGNGASLFIVVNILSNIPELIIKNWNLSSFSIVTILGTLILFLIAMVSAQQLTKTIALPKDSMFIPFKMNTAGVLP